MCTERCRGRCEPRANDRGTGGGIDLRARVALDRLPCNAANVAEADRGGRDEPPGPVDSGRLNRLERIADDAQARTDWLAEAASAGTPLVMVHTVLRDLVPPGSLSLTPTDADAGSHGVLLGDPLLSLVAARRVALLVHRRLRLQQGAAVAANAAFMTATAFRWLPPIATALLHHGFVLLLLLDSLRVESLREDDASAASRQTRHSQE